MSRPVFVVVLNDVHVPCSIMKFVMNSNAVCRYIFQRSGGFDLNELTKIKHTPFKFSGRKIDCHRKKQLQSADCSFVDDRHYIYAKRPFLLLTFLANDNTWRRIAPDCLSVDVPWTADERMAPTNKLDGPPRSTRKQGNMQFLLIKKLLGMLTMGAMLLFRDESDFKDCCRPIGCFGVKICVWTGTAVHAARWSAYRRQQRPWALYFLTGPYINRDAFCCCNSRPLFTRCWWPRNRGRMPWLMWLVHTTDDAFVIKKNNLRWIAQGCCTWKARTRFASSAPTAPGEIDTCFRMYRTRWKKVRWVGLSAENSKRSIKAARYISSLANLAASFVNLANLARQPTDHCSSLVCGKGAYC